MAILYIATDIIPQLTSNTTPSPYEVTYSSAFSTSYGYKAFDNTIGADYKWLANGATGWLKIDIGSGNTVVIGAYTIQDNNEGGYQTRNPKSWTLEGSNNDINYTIIDTQSNITWTLNEKKTFVLSTRPAAYRYFKLNVTANNGDTYLAIGEMELYKAVITNGFFFFL